MKTFIQIIRKNTIPILFFSFIIFGVLSFVDTQNRYINQLKNLIDYGEKSSLLLSAKTRRIADKTLVGNNSVEYFDSIIDELNTLIEESNRLSEELPNESNSEEYKNLRNKIEQVLLLYEDNLSLTKELYVKRSNLLPSLKVYTEIENLSTQNFTTQQTSIQNVLNYLSWEKEKFWVNQPEYEIRKRKLELLTISFDKIPKDNPSMDSLENFKKIFAENNITIRDNLPVLSTSEIETPQLLKLIKQQNDEIKNIKKIHGIG